MGAKLSGRKGHVCISLVGKNPKKYGFGSSQMCEKKFHQNQSEKKDVNEIFQKKCL